MANHVFLFPDVGEGIHEAQLVEWLASVGDTMKEDQPLCRVETDKAIVELPAPVSGVLAVVHNQPGELIFVGNPLAEFTTEGGAAAAASAPAAEAAPAVATPAAGGAHLSAIPGGGQPAPQGNAAPQLHVVADSNRRPQDVPATPHTRALARTMGVDITTVAGTGRGGRVTPEDIERAAAGGGAPAVAAPAAASAAAPAVAQAAPAAAPARPAPANVEITEDGPVERVPLTFLRRKIAEQMQTSFQRLVHVTHVEEADVTELFEVYRKAKKLLKTRDVKLSPLPYFIKAIVSCLKDYPIFNCSYDHEKQELVYKKYYNIGMAVDTPEGLVVPVLKDADRKDIFALAQEISDKAKRAQTRELQLDEMRGGTFTVSNVGTIGGVLATPIINYPEVAIVALHTIQDKPAVVDGRVCVRKKMYLSMSFDHQIIDGGDAARFMRQLAEMLETPDYLFTRL